MYKTFQINGKTYRWNIEKTAEAFGFVGTTALIIGGFAFFMVFSYWG